MNQQFCSRENQLLQMLQQNEKSTQKLGQRCISPSTYRRLLGIPVSTEFSFSYGLHCLQRSDLTAGEQPWHTLYKASVVVCEPKEAL